MKVIPLDTRKRILARYDTGRFTRAETAEQFGVSEDFVRKMLKQRKKLGHVAPLYAHVGRKRSVTEEDGERMLAVIRANPGVTLEGLCAEIGGTRAVSAAFFTLRRMNVSYKKNATRFGAGPRGRARGARGMGPANGDARRAIPRVR